MPDGEADQPDRTRADVEAETRAHDGRLLRRVRGRLALWSGGATLVVLLALGLAIQLTVRDSLTSGAIAEALARADAVARYVERGGPLPEAPLAITMTGRGSSTYAFLAIPRAGLDPRILQASDFEAPVPPDAAAVARAFEVGRDILERTIEGAPWRILTERRMRSGEPYVIQVFQDRAAEQRALETLTLVLVGGGLLALVGAIVVGAFYAERALVPIRQSLADRRAALQRQREFAADASHELRTPLTIVRSSVEHLRRHPETPVRDVGSALDDIDAEVTHLSTLVDDLLLLARADSGALDLSRQPLELGDLATEAAAALSAPAEGRGVRVQVDPEPVMVHGDPVRLRQLITILVDNAVRHSPRPGVVDVTIRRDREDAVLTVLDQGPGIPPDDLPRVFDRFWRGAAESDSGAGLGLAIAAAIVTRHEGRIGVANRPGGGAAFTVVLPVAGWERTAGA